MAKRSNKSKQNDDLDLILQQLKDVYATPDTLDEPSDNEDELSEDEELNAILSKIFTSSEEHIEEPVDASKKMRKDAPINNAVSSASIEKNDIEAMIDRTEDPVSLEDSNLQEIPSEPSSNLQDAPLVDPAQTEIVAEDQSVQFENLLIKQPEVLQGRDIKADTSPQDFIEEKNVNIAEDVNENTLHLVDEGKSVISASNEEDTSSLPLTNEKNDSKNLSTDSSQCEASALPAKYFDIPSVFEQEAELTKLDDEGDTLEDLPIIMDDGADDESFAVEDEEYDILSETKDIVEPKEINETSFDIQENIQSDDTREIEVSADYAVEEDLSDPSYRRSYIEPIEQEIKSPVILDPANYIFDSLQEKLPVYLKIAEKENISAAIIQDSISDDNALNDKDVSLLLKFGYDDEVKAEIGEQETRKATFEKDGYFIPERHQKIFGFCGKELTSRSQISQIKSKYRSDKRSLIIKLAVLSIISLLILATDLYFEFFSSRTSYPIVMIFELLLVAVMALVLYKNIYTGILGILRFDAGRYSLLVLVMAVYVLYNISAVILYIADYNSIDHSELMVFGLSVSLYTLWTVIADLFNCLKEASVFAIIASSDTLYTAEKQGIISSETENEAVEESRQTLKQKLSADNAYQIQKTSLISGYFKRTARDRSGSVNLIYILGIIPIISLVAGCLSAIFGAGLMRGISVMVFTLMMGIPLTYTFLSTCSELLMLSWTRKYHAAFIGSEAVTTYAKTEKLTFKDIDTVDVISYTEIHPIKNADSKKYISIAHTVLKSLGGPFAKAIPNTPDTDEHSISINSIVSNGINIYYDSSINILIGDKNYMNSHKIKVKVDTNLTTAVKGTDREVIYMAFDGIPRLGFIINSKIKAEFSQTVAILAEKNIKTLVRTYEPQINKNYFEQNLKQLVGVETVYKPQKFELNHTPALCKGNIVCSSNALDVAHAIILCDQICEQRRHNRHLHFSLVLAGLCMSILMTVLINLPTLPPILMWAKKHLSFIFNIFMLMGTVPGIIELIKIKKQHNGDAETK